MTDDHPTPTPPQAPAQAELLHAALAKINANLDLFLGKPLATKTSRLGETTGAEVAARLSPPSFVVGVRASGAVDADLHCVVAQPLVIAMHGVVTHRSAADVTKRLEGSPDLDDAERAGADEIASFITAALGDFAKETTGGRIVLAPLEPRSVQGSEPPPWNAAGRFFALDSDVLVAGGHAGVVTLLFPSEAVAAWRPPEATSVFAALPEAPAAAAPPPPTRESLRPAAAPPAPPAAAGSAEVVWVTGGAPFVEAVQAAAGSGFVVHAMPSLADVLSAARSGAAPGLLVVEIASGDEFELDLVGALRRHPMLRQVRVMVALEAPSKSSVVRCGSLGIFDVIPSALDPKALGERLAVAARAKPAARAR